MARSESGADSRIGSVVDVEVEVLSLAYRPIDAVITHHIPFS